MKLDWTNLQEVILEAKHLGDFHVVKYLGRENYNIPACIGASKRRGAVVASCPFGMPEDCLC